ncbi:hypothetical protein [Lysinibacillus sp. NPDC093692]|uniref:hypothetical protein n=1 Tax=Lysinibacillus sp. NPDC093692 TaxID=3390578 RepID=UPI003D0347C6
MANTSSNNVSVINGVTNTVIATIPVGGHPFEVGVAVDPNTDFEIGLVNLLWMAK